MDVYVACYAIATDLKASGKHHFIRTVQAAIMEAAVRDFTGIADISSLADFRYFYL